MKKEDLKAIGKFTVVAVVIVFFVVIAICLPALVPVPLTPTIRVYSINCHETP